MSPPLCPAHRNKTKPIVFGGSRGAGEIFDGVPTRREEGRVVAVIDGLPDETIQ